MGCLEASWGAVMAGVRGEAPPVGRAAALGIAALDLPAAAVGLLCRGSGGRHSLDDGDADSATGNMNGQLGQLAAGACDWASNAAADRERVFFAVATAALLTATYAFWCWFFMVAVGRWNLCGLAKHKLRARLPPPSASLVRHAIADAAVNQLVVRPAVLFAVYPLVRARVALDASELPDAHEAMAELCVCAVVDDVLFYVAHRVMHEDPWLYRHVHKQHHEFKHTVAVAVEYAHPVEDALNTLATAGGAVAMRSHVLVLWAYVCVKLWQSIDAHSGYDLPFPWSPWSAVACMDSAPAHAYHHAETRGNYGGYFTLCDRIGGTYRRAKRANGNDAKAA